MSQRKHGAVLSYISIFTNIAIGLVLTPILVRNLGQSEYGLYIIVGSFAAYLTIMDLGLNDSVIRYVAKYRALKDRQSEENFLAIISVIYACISLLIVAVGLLIYVNLPAMFERSLNTQEMASAKTMLAILLVNVTATILFNPISATILAYERFVLQRTLEIVSRVLVAVGVVAVLLLGHKAVAVVVVTAVVNLFVLLYKIVYAFCILKIRLKLHRFKWDKVTEIFKYSMAIFVVVIVEQIYWKLDNVILGIMLNPSVVAVYAIGMSFHKYFMSFGTAISKVLIPKIVRNVEHGQSNKELTNQLISVSRIQAIVLFLVLSGLILYGREFIVLWVGGEYESAYYVMLITLIPYSLEMIGNIRNVFLQAKDLYWYRALTVLVLSLVNVGLTIIMVNMWGMIGAAISTGLGITLGYVAVNVIMKWKAGLEMERYTRELVTGILPAVILSGTLGALLNLVTQISWVGLVAKVASYTLLYLICLWYIGMNDYEKQLIGSLMRFKKAPMGF